jgi:uncharacterized protein YheU (UPF0270 family)
MTLQSALRGSGSRPASVRGRRAAVPIAGLAAGLAAVGMLAAAPAKAQTSQVVPGDVYTIDGLATDTGLGGPALQAAIGTPDGVLVNHGNIYVADGEGNRVLEVAGADQTQWGIRMTKGDVYLIAGSQTGVPGSSGNGTPAARSRLSDPVSLAMDNSGDLFIADLGNDRVMELTASARPWGDMRDPRADALYRVAGIGGERGDGGDAVPAVSSELDGPTAVFIGGSAGGNLYIADSFNNRIQVVPQVNETRWGQSMRTYDVYTVAGSKAGLSGSGGDGRPAASGKLDDPLDVTVDNSGDLLVADTDNCRIQEVAKATGTQWGSVSMKADHVYTVAGRNGFLCTGGANDKPARASDLNLPAGVADPDGNLYVADTSSNVVKEVAGRTGTQYGQSMTAGDVYAVAGTGVAGSSGNGGPAASAELDTPEAVWASGSGTVYIADTGNSQIRAVSATAPYDMADAAGNGFTLFNAGDNGPALTSSLFNPDGVAIDSQGDLFIADAANERVQEIAETSHAQFGIQMTAGDTYTVAGSATGAAGTSGNGVPATSALLNVPVSVAVDGNGDLYIADANNNRIVEVAATAHTQFGIVMKAGDSYTVAGSVTGTEGDTGDGGPATGALLSTPSGVAVDEAGDLFIADTLNSRIQEVPATSGTNFGIAMTAGDMYTIAGSATGAFGSSGDGGPGFSALLSDPFGLSVDGAGNVYVADSGNNRVQELAATTHSQWGISMTGGDIYTIAGSASGTPGNSGDGGPATSATLFDPADVAVGSAGNLYIADTLNNQVREIAGASGSQYGQSMTAGDIYTVAGVLDAAAGLTESGWPATDTLLYLPIDVGTDPGGDLFTSDVLQGSMLEVAAGTTSPFPVYPASASAAAQSAIARAALARLRPGGGCLAGAGGQDQRILGSESIQKRLAPQISKIFAQLGLLGNSAAGSCR